MKLAMRPKWGRLVRIFASAVGMGVIVEVAHRIGVPLGGLLALGAVTYIGLLFVLRALTPADVRGFLRRDPIS
jgi:hypothetical protein